MSKRLGELALDMLRVLDADSLDSDRLCHRRKVRIFKLGPGVDEPGRFLLQFYEAERAIVENDDLDRPPKLFETEPISHQHGEPAVAGERDHLSPGTHAAYAIAFSIEPCQKEPSEANSTSATSRGPFVVICFSALRVLSHPCG
jgi:hypothetical protein